MIDRTQLAALTPSQRADVIYRQAQSDLAQNLWRAALGDGGARDENPAPWAVPDAQRGGLNALLALMGDGDVPAAIRALGPSGPEALPEDAPLTTPSVEQTPPLRSEGLGPNSRFAAAINDAAERTGIPAAALATIVDAEAARGRDGSWNVYSRNPRSSAAGLGQFLSGTWEGEAERPGTWLNGEARRRGWLNEAGQVSADARGSLLALRYDPEASINATADYASRNLQRLERAGARIGDDVTDIARAAYLGHHLGPGDAARFLTGGLEPARARRLLDAQVGLASAARRVAEAGDATAAHREWLTAYVDRRIRPERFA